MRGWMGRVVWRATALCSYVNSCSLLVVRYFAGALSQMICCLIRCFCFSLQYSHREPGSASILRGWQQPTFHGAGSPRSQQSAGDSALGRFVDPQKRLKFLLLLTLIMPLRVSLDVFKIRDPNERSRGCSSTTAAAPPSLQHRLLTSRRPGSMPAALLWPMTPSATEPGTHLLPLARLPHLLIEGRPHLPPRPGRPAGRAYLPIGRKACRPCPEIPSIVRARYLPELLRTLVVAADAVKAPSARVTINRRFGLSSDPSSFHDSASFFEFQNASTNSTSLRGIYILF